MFITQHIVIVFFNNKSTTVVCIVVQCILYMYNLNVFSNYRHTAPTHPLL